jgi:hypothetical protein
MLRIDQIDEDELAHIHQSIAGRLAVVGLKGVELDEAIASVFSAEIAAIEKHRKAERDRRSRLRVVK